MSKFEKYYMGSSGKIDTHIDSLLAHVLALTEKYAVSEIFLYMSEMIPKLWGKEVRPCLLKDKELICIMKRIKKSPASAIGKESCAAMIATAGRADSGDKFRLALVAHCFWAICRLLEKGRHRSSIISGADRVRIDYRTIRLLLGEQNSPLTRKVIIEKLEEAGGDKFHPIILLLKDGQKQPEKKKYVKPKRVTAPEPLPHEFIYIDPIPIRESAAGDYERRVTKHRTTANSSDQPVDTEYLVDGQDSRQVVLRSASEADETDTLPGEARRRAQGRLNQKQRRASNYRYARKYQSDSTLSFYVSHWMQGIRDGE